MADMICAAQRVDAVVGIRVDCLCEVDACVRLTWYNGSMETTHPAE